MHLYLQLLSSLWCCCSFYSGWRFLIFHIRKFFFFQRRFAQHWRSLVMRGRWFRREILFSITEENVSTSPHNIIFTTPRTQDTRLHAVAIITGCVFLETTTSVCVWCCVMCLHVPVRGRVKSTHPEADHFPIGFNVFVSGDCVWKTHRQTRNCGPAPAERQERPWLHREEILGRRVLLTLFFFLSSWMSLSSPTGITVWIIPSHKKKKKKGMIALHTKNRESLWSIPTLLWATIIFFFYMYCLFWSQSPIKRL